MTPCVTAIRQSTSPDLLGESPVWDDRIGRLYWVDGVSNLIRFHDLSEDSFGSIEMPSSVGAVALCADQDQLLVGLADGIYTLKVSDPKSQLEPLYKPEPRNERVRFNDGKVDRQGRFLIGTMGIFAEPVGELIRLSPDGSVEKLASGIRISNSLCFSPDGAALYFADSLDRAIRAYSYSADAEPLTDPRRCIDTRPYHSGPDGATVDADGYIWVALVQAGKIGRFAPDGTLDRMVEAPVDMPSCVNFGGSDLSVLFMTSIKDSGSGRAISRHPSAGYLFSIEGLGVTGIAEPKFGQQS